MANLISKILGTGSDRELRAYQSRLEEVEAFAAGFAAAADEELQTASAKLRGRALAGDSLEDLLPEAFALVREASERILGLRHYDVQLLGAMALHAGSVAEMATGEGKTLAAVPAAYLNALAGGPVHVVTVNDYLARRDATEMGPLYEFLGLSVGLIQAESKPEERRAAYACDVTYGTNAQMGFDYLKDNMAKDPSERVQRGHGFAVVDEADSSLIDEARTPLVISGLGEAAAAEYERLVNVVEALDPEGDVVVDAERKVAWATEAGLDKVEEMLDEEIYADATGRLANHLRQALRARFCYRRDVDYVVKDGQVKIVDAFTGRILEGRRYSEGLHQAIEAREGVQVRRESLTMASTTLQNYFRLYKKLSGMTGTALTEDSELKRTYGLKVVAIPTNAPVIRKDHPDYVYRTAEAKMRAIADEVERRHAKGQPVLVGTDSVKSSETLSKMLEERGILHSVLNAKNHEAEARIVAQAGREGAVTISTNMAGRGTDILLGGNRRMLKEDHLESLVRWNNGETFDWMDRSAHRYADSIVEREGYSTRVLGGLFVIGAARFEARRVDDQLRGRAGRQGDPGETRFYLSLEDDLLVAFGGDRLKAVSDMMERRGLGDDSPIEDVAVSKVITAAQREMEAAHFSQRKFLLDFDDVMNRQRLAIYKERNAVLEGEKDVEALLREVARDSAFDAVALCCPAGDPSDDWNLAALEGWWFSMTGTSPFELPGSDGGAFSIRDVEHGEDPDALAAVLADALEHALSAKREALGDDAFESVARRSLLEVLDRRWVLHQQDMDRLRQGIMLRAVGRREPLLEFKEESYGAFGELVASVYEDWLSVLLHLAPAPAADEEPAATISFGAPAEVTAARGEAESATDFSPITDNPLG